MIIFIKKIVLPAVIMILSNITFAQSGFTISGHIKGLDTGRIMLKYDYNEKTIIDTVKIKKGLFVFTGKLNGPTFSQMATTDFKFMHDQFIENTKMKLTGIKDSAASVVFSGSPSQDINVAFGKSLNPLYDRSWVIRGEIDSLSKIDSLAAERKSKELEQVFANINQKTIEFVKDKPSSIVSLYKLADLVNSAESKELNSLYLGLNASLRASSVGKMVGTSIESKMKTEIGVEAMNFTQNDVDGNPISLASLKGKYVLVDFWASWCGPCRAENPNVVKSYNKYKDKGFEILGVSLDQKADKWKEAITKDQLTWKQVSDLQGWGNAVAVQYGVRSVPANFLISPAGVIIAKNLRGEDLEKKLAELFVN